MVREKSNKARLNNKKKQNDAPPKKNIPTVIPGNNSAHLRPNTYLREISHTYVQTPRIHWIILGAQHHVNKILNSADKDAKKKDSHDKIYLDRSKVFRDKLRQSFEAEKINKLRWQIRLGDEIPTFDELEEVRQEWVVFYKQKWRFLGFRAKNNPNRVEIWNHRELAKELSAKQILYLNILPTLIHIVILRGALGMLLLANFNKQRERSWSELELKIDFRNWENSWRWKNIPIDNNAANYYI